ncbi:MAG: peptidoglycan DD-metalloendopeptidase family protein [Lysinibacillus sp.]|nr:peptidoglycan DD-metalloendopeptidase family protein [Lysinibacillus sp.]
MDYQFSVILWEKGGLGLARKIFTILFILLLWVHFPSTTFANESMEDIHHKRMSLYKSYQNHIVPWYRLAAVDQYERNIQDVRKDIPKRDSTIAIQFSHEFWAGELNPNVEDTSPFSIEYFGGRGLDGNGDGKADRHDDQDILVTMVNFFSEFGPSEEDFKTALWEYYKDEKIINQIMTIKTLYKHFNTTNLDKHVFPLPVRGYNYSYIGTWGASRGLGGRRIHEGTDIFAGYGTPVLSTSYGVVEVMGWNQFGGWRIGIRDNHNTYHYYAHLAYFNKDLKVGDIVEPGQIIGGVGSSGYGKEGTSGKFPPHLHYGMYKFNGRTEWAFDPYPSLLQWEKETKKSQ